MERHAVVLADYLFLNFTSLLEIVFTGIVC